MTPKSTASQQFVPLKEVKDGVAILKDGSMRAIIMSSSLNFALKSEENQQAIIYQFQTFLNSLDFSIQLFIQSRRLDIRPYIALLESRYKEQTNELFRLQTSEYIKFIKEFTENTSIMTKTFFIVVPYSAPVIQSSSFPLIGKKQEASERKENETKQFEEYKSQLEQRVSVVEQGLTRCGLRAVQLGNEEIIELFYKIFNPGDTDKPIQLK